MVVTNSLRPIFSLQNRIPTRIITNRSRFIYSISKFSTNVNTNSNSNIIKSPYSDIEIPKISITEFVFSETGKWGHHIVSECAVTERKFTYDEMQKYANNLTGFLMKKMKLRKGDVVGILCPNCPEYVIMALGIINRGLIATTINPIYTPEEISRQLSDSDTKVLITLTENWNTAKSAVDLAKKSIPIITVNTENGQTTPEGAINFYEKIHENCDISDIPKPMPEDIAFMPYSSGTTGLPKGVLLTHSNIVSNVTQMRVPEIDYIGTATKDRQFVIPSILPLFHIYGLVITMINTLLRGSKSVCLPKFAPKLFIDTLKNHKPDALFVAPPIVIFMNTQDAVKPEYLSSIDIMISGAAPLGAKDEQKFLEKAQKNIIIGQGYGLTETSPVVAITPKFEKSPPGSIGLPIPKTEAKIVDVSNPSITLGPNQTGELLVRGPQVMKGYHQRPEETEEIFREDGWMKTGDIAMFDENENLFITDRLKELIKVKGFQVPPAELEEIIRSHPDIADVGVIGIPHERYGQVPRAYVCLKAGIDKNSFESEKLKDFVRNKVANYKELKGGIKVLDSIPKNPSGKILRRELKEYFEKHECA